MQLDEPRPAKHARQACGPARQLAAHATTAAPHAIFLYQGQSPEIATFGPKLAALAKRITGEVCFGTSHLNGPPSTRQVTSSTFFFRYGSTLNRSFRRGGALFRALTTAG